MYVCILTYYSWVCGFYIIVPSPIQTIVFIQFSVAADSAKLVGFLLAPAFESWSYLFDLIVLLS